MAARIHHYVPQCYLKNFTQEGQKTSQLIVLDASEGKLFKTTPRNVAAERDFNRIDVEGLPTDAVEIAYSEFENELDGAIQRTRQTRSFRGEDKEYVLNLIALMAVRNPRSRDQISNFENRVFKQILRLSFATKDRWESQLKQMKAKGYMQGVEELDYETLKAFVDKGDYSFITSTTEHVRLELSVLDGLLPHLFNRKWTLLKASDDSGGFITSDHPVCLKWSSQKTKNKNQPIGFGLPYTEVIFPISPELGLVGSFEGIDSEQEADVFSVGSINSIVVGSAERQIYAPNNGFICFRGLPDGFIRGADLLNDPSFKRSKTSADKES
jgi:hypothetical protein